MNVEEIFIAHKLYGNPEMMHVTPDGKKIYFLLKGHLMFIEHPDGLSYSGKSDEELNSILQEALKQSTS